MVFLLILVVAMPLLGTIGHASADSLQNSATQRIGNYEVQMATDPANPTPGKNTNVMIRIASVDGQDLVDVPIVISVVKDNKEMARTHPILVPYGHHSYQFTFPEEGVYALMVDVTDNLGTGQTLTFTFRIQIVQYDLSLILPVSIATGIIAIISYVIIVRKKKGRKKIST